MQKLNQLFEKLSEKVATFLAEKVSLTLIIPLALLLVSFIVIWISAYNSKANKVLRRAKKAIGGKGDIPSAINEEISKAEAACVKPSEFFSFDKYLKLPLITSISFKAGRIMFCVTLISVLFAMMLSMSCYGLLTFYAGIPMICVLVLGTILSVICLIISKRAADSAQKNYYFISNHFDMKYHDKLKTIYQAEESSVTVDTQLLAEIDRIYHEGDSLLKMKEAALRLQEERQKPQNQDKASQQVLSAALDKLLKAMNENINR